MAKDINKDKNIEKESPLEPKITYASNDRSLEFIFDTDGEAKAGAIAAMDSVYPNDGIRTEIADLDLASGRGMLDWDYYGVMALKTTLRFNKVEGGEKDDAWKLDISKVRSEGTSFRRMVEEAIGKKSLPSEASIGIEFGSDEESARYLEMLGLALDENELGQQAQGKVFWSLTMGLRNAVGDYDESKEGFKGTDWEVTDPEDMFNPVLEVASELDTDTKREFNSALFRKLFWHTKSDDPRGFREFAECKTEDDVTARLFSLSVEQFENGDLNPGVFLGRLTDGLEILYDALEGQPELQAKLYEKVLANTERRFAQQGRSVPEEFPFDYQDHRPLFSTGDVLALLVPKVEDPRITTSVRASIKGMFSIRERTFTPRSMPREFTVYASPTKESELVDDQNIQQLLNAAASVLALQRPRFLDERNGAAPEDRSHAWAADSLAHALLHSDDAKLQKMGTRLIDMAEGTETLYY